MAAIQVASVRSDQEQVRRLVIISRLVGIPLLIVVGLIPGIGPVWTMALVTAVCSGEIIADLAAANS
jgi:TctA family transporter